MHLAEMDPETLPHLRCKPLWQYLMTGKRYLLLQRSIFDKPGFLDPSL